MQNQNVKTIEESVKEFVAVLGFSVDDKVSEEQAQLIRNFIIFEKKRRQFATRHAEFENQHKVYLSMRGDIKTITERISELPLETALYNALLANDLTEFKMQYEIGKFRADFAFPKEKVVIEADGHQWHRENSMQIDREIARDKYLARKGWRILHFQGIEIKRDLETCIAKIKKALGKK